MVNPTVAGLLVAWSLGAAVWWMIALTIASWTRRPRLGAMGGEWPMLTVFKALPRCTESGPDAGVARALVSFARQLGPGSEMVLGIHACDRRAFRRVIRRVRAAGGGRVRFVFRSEPDRCTNPKVAWMEALASEASGAWWLWSDADVVAPPGFLDQARAAFAAAPRGFVTFPYRVGGRPTATQLLDAVFVNAEFRPGALLLGRRGRVDFAFGAACLFAAEEFHRRVSWARLGEALADDFVLGQALAPGRVCPIDVSTLANETTWRGALQHYLRWHKTIRWCRPDGYAAQMAIVPLLGWLAATAWLPHVSWLWMGTAATIGFEAMAALLLCWTAGCRPRAHALCLLPLWPLLRAMCWVAVWFPWPVHWRDRVWWSPCVDADAWRGRGAEG